MYRHWNEAPHRFGLFSENGRVRPQYFVYQMLGRLQGGRLSSASQHPDLAVLAGRQDDQVAVMLVNHNPQAGQDRIVRINYTNLPPGLKHLSACRIDDTRRWSDETLEMIPVDERMVDTMPSFAAQFYCPADSVLLVDLRPA
jgi:mitochondrial fission protein ELM1